MAERSGRMEGERLNSLWSLIAGNEVLCATTSPSGREIAVGTDTACLVLDAHTGSRTFSTGETSGRVTAAAFAGEGRLLVGGQGKLQLWDVQSNTVLAGLQLHDGAADDNRAQERVCIATRDDRQLFGVASELGRCACGLQSLL